ncbi:MAG: glycoside hydrolase family 55 protein [Alphaproteobacteria bacterium]|nr:glycoside hydrolase family 55 protein [Alphaproteobacteria bacterium]
MTDHIKMPDVTPIVRYLADGEQTTFAYPFPIFASEDLGVYIDGAKQVSGYALTGAGVTGGGDVTFETPPADGALVTLARELPIERVTDYLEGGDFSANSINTELDYLVAALQQVDRANDLTLRYSDFEAPGDAVLPTKALRANKALGFDGDGNPVAVSLEGSMAAPDFTAQGTGAVTRTATDKLGDLISVKDFGAAGDGITDDTLAFQKALAVHDAILIPRGVFLITGTVSLDTRKSLIGLGQRSVIKAQSNSFFALEIPAGFTTVSNLRIEGGLVGIKLWGKDAECVQNTVSDVQIIGAATGIVLDGYNDTNKPCYWNHFSRVLIEQPTLHGVHMIRTGVGDTPNANRFYAVRVFSKSAPTTGSGFYVEHGAFNNSFVDCEANVNGPTAHSCFRIGAGSNKTMLINLLTESTNTVPNVRLDAGSVETIIMNLTATSDGAAIYDFSGGNYEALNAGFPVKNRMRKTSVTDLNTTLQRFDTEFIDTPGTVALDLSHSVHIVNATSGAITTTLPAAADAVGVQMTVKKVDGTANIVTVNEDSGPGPDGKEIQLGGANDFVTILSNGASWFITASNRQSANTRYHDGTGTYDIDMAVDTYLLSSFGGPMTARLPPADATESIGRCITIKKTDLSGNAITVTEQGGTGPDQSPQSLSAQWQSITVLSNGADWYVTARYP